MSASRAARATAAPREPGWNELQPQLPTLLRVGLAPRTAEADPSSIFAMKAGGWGDDKSNRAHCPAHLASPYEPFDEPLNPDEWCARNDAHLDTDAFDLYADAPLLEKLGVLNPELGRDWIDFLPLPQSSDPNGQECKHCVDSTQDRTRGALDRTRGAFYHLNNDSGEQSVLRTGH